MKTRLLAVALAVLGASCSNDFRVPMRDGGTVGTDGGVTLDGSVTSDSGGPADAGPGPIDGGGTTSDAASGDAALNRDGGSVTCEQLRTQYDQAMGRAKICNPTAANTCTVTRKEHIDCGCQVPVSLSNQTDLGTIDYLSMQWASMNCMAGVTCPAIGCPATTVGTCVPSINGGPAMCGRTP